MKHHEDCLAADAYAHDATETRWANVPGDDARVYPIHVAVRDAVREAFLAGVRYARSDEK